MRFFLLVLFATSMTFSQTSQFAKKATDKHSMVVLGLALTSVVITQPHDDEIRTQWYQHQKISKSSSQIGDWMGTGLVGVAATALQYVYDQNENHWLSHGSALAWGTLITYGLKYSFGRQRPGNSDSHHSFPSGHTTTAFVTATSLSYAYGWKAAVIAYPLATFVGLSRLSDDSHWGSDVVAGVYLGYWVGRSFFIEDSEEVDEQQSYLFPIISPEAQGLGWVYQF